MHTRVYSSAVFSILSIGRFSRGPTTESDGFFTAIKPIVALYVNVINTNTKMNGLAKASYKVANKIIFCLVVELR